MKNAKYMLFLQIIQLRHNLSTLKYEMVSTNFYAYTVI